MMHKRVTVVLEHGSDLICQSAAELSLHVGDQCVIQADRVLEFGRVIRIEEVSGEPPGRVPTILRCATLQDQSKANENAVMRKMAHEVCVKKVSELRLSMHLVNVRYSFDRGLLSVVFTAEERVDFREFVRQVAGDLNTQVEMKQIGVRDTAKVVGGLGPCGCVQCCSRWMKSFEAVSVKMAKVQRLSLSPNTISGMCGRLKCCLRYEYQCYRECGEGFPRDGARVQCPQGVGRVAEKDILGGRVKVRLDDDRILEFDVKDIRAVRTQR